VLLSIIELVLCTFADKEAYVISYIVEISFLFKFVLLVDPMWGVLDYLLKVYVIKFVNDFQHIFGYCLSDKDYGITETRRAHSIRYLHFIFLHEL
jgi:hypothetical protein